MHFLSPYAAAVLSLATSVAAVPQTSLGDFKIPRNRICNVRSYNNGSDDTPAILSAINSCNPGGKVVFLANSSYTIGTAMNLTYLQHIDIQVLGNITFTNDTDYWQANAFYQTFQNATTFFQMGGTDVNFYGPGIIDGNGQAWYDLYAQNIYILRPILIGIVGLKSSTIGPLTLRYSPQYYHWVVNSSNVLFTGIDIRGDSTSRNPAKNTDGWDTYRSNLITIQNSTVNNGDDCVSFKPNSTNMVVQNLVCNGSHGISVGSLGQYKGEYDIVENILVRNISMSNAQNGARIKVWPGTPSALSGDLQGGGGSGRVNNITFDGFYNYNNDYTIMLTQCYGQNNLTLCNQFPSSLTITNIVFNNFTGTSSKKNEPVTGYVVCSSPGVCNNITATNINVQSPKNVTDYFQCANVDRTKLAVSCH